VTREHLLAVDDGIASGDGYSPDVVAIISASAAGDSAAARSYARYIIIQCICDFAVECAPSFVSTYNDMWQTKITYRYFETLFAKNDPSVCLSVVCVRAPILSGDKARCVIEI